MSRRQYKQHAATKRGKWQGMKKRGVGVSIDERAEWAWARWSEALRRANKEPGDGALAAAVASRRQELDALLAVATPAMQTRVEERQRRRKRGRGKKHVETAGSRTD